MKIVFDPFETNLLTDEERSVIEEEIKLFRSWHGEDALKNLIFHDMGVDTEHKFVMSARSETEIFVTRYGLEDEITEEPNL